MIILSSELLYIPEKLYYGWEGKYNLSSHLNSLGGGGSLFLKSKLWPYLFVLLIILYYSLPTS